MTIENTVKKKKKLTLNKAGLILLALLVFACLYVSQVNIKNRNLALTLENDLYTSQTMAGALSGPAEGLEDKLREVENELAATLESFPKTVDRNEVVDYVLSVAVEHGITVLPLQSNGWSAEYAGQQYEVLSIKVNAEGSLKSVEDFINRLQKGKYPTLTISDCSVQRRSVGAPGFPGDEMPVAVSLSLAVYTAPAPLAEVL